MLLLFLTFSEQEVLTVDMEIGFAPSSASLPFCKEGEVLSSSFGGQDRRKAASVLPSRCHLKLKRKAAKRGWWQMGLVRLKARQSGGAAADWLLGES